MNTEIKKMLMRGESETVEFKESFHDDALETIGAFSNAQGGVLFVGVGDSGKIVGVQIGKKTIKDWSNRIQEATEPRIQPSVLVYEVGEKSIIVIQVSKVLRGPVSIRGRYFKRTGKTNQRMSHEEIMHRIVLSSGLSWDGFVEPSATLEDLDAQKINRFVSKVREKKRLSMPEKIGDMAVLKKMALVIEDQPTRAAVLLFGKNPDHFFFSAFLKIGRFRSSTLIVDDLEVHETLFEQLEESMIWFRQRLETAFIISGKLERDVIWEFPLDAIREAIINAICHRDYLSSAHSQIRLYDEHLVIRNAGGLPPTLKTEMLFQDHDSIPRNKKIADAFFYAGLIEKWGSGTTRIVDELKTANMPLPEFVSDIWSFQVIFYKNRLSDELLKKQGLSERQLKAVAYAREHGKITNSQYQRLSGVSKATASRELRELKLKRIFDSAGTRGAGSAYKIIGSIGF